MKKFTSRIYQNKGDYSSIIFLDRDGVINREVDYLHKKEDIEILPGVTEGIKLLNKKNVAVVVVSNHAVVARGLLTIESAKKLNDEIAGILSKEGAVIDAVYFCPHHPNADVAEFRVICECRKPGVLMFKSALREFGDKKILGMIGDKATDIESGKNLGIKTVLVTTGYGEKEQSKITPDFIANNFLESVKILLN